MGKTSKNSWAMKQEHSLGTCSKKRCQWTSGQYFVFWVRLSTGLSLGVVTPVRASDWRCLIVGLTSTRCRETALLNSSNWEKTCISRNVKLLVFTYLVKTIVNLIFPCLFGYIIACFKLKKKLQTKIWEEISFEIFKKFTKNNVFKYIS